MAVVMVHAVAYVTLLKNGLQWPRYAVNVERLLSNRKRQFSYFG